MPTHGANLALQRWIARACCLALGVLSDAPGAEPREALPEIVLVGHRAPPSYAPSVAKRLEGRARVTPISCAAAEQVVARHPSIVHLDCGTADGGHVGGLISTFIQRTSRVVVALSVGDIESGFRTPDGSLRPDRVIHDLRWLRETGAGEDAFAEAVADCAMRHVDVMKLSAASPPRPSGPEAAEKYRRVEAERDAAVPPHYRDFKFGTFSPPTSKEAWTSQRQAVSKVVTGSLGELPPRPSPAKARLVSREIHAAYKLERVAIDNGDGNDISAILLIPRVARRPMPAILWLHSSTPDKNQIIAPNANGGETPLGEEFVRAGYVVLAPDACLYGDRAANGPSGSKEMYRRGVADSFPAAQDRLFKWNMWLGRTLWGMFVRDDQIALDYLCARPEVDVARIGATGMSMGSTRSWWLAALDERIAATVGVACLTRYQNLIRHGNLRAHGLYYFNYGMLKHFDTEAVLALIAPRPFLALTGDLDYGSPADGIRELEDATGRVYAALGASDKFRNILYRDVGHAYTPEMRSEMLEWFERWLSPQKAAAAKK